VLKAVEAVGYETPSPIQAKTIPFMMQGRDVLGQAQTGTGKTAAFALPILSRIDLKQRDPQVLVLAPTRELAIQVAEAFQKYAHHLKGFHVLPIYGGQPYTVQLKQLQRGAHVIVGTPGRVMDHMRRGTLKLGGLKTLVLDEADEMLRMGFIDDVTWVLEQTPPTRQIALFSATMPAPIRKIADKHLNKPEHISIDVKTTTADTIRQHYWIATGAQKLEALTRMLEAEDIDAMIIFVRTKTATTELAEKLEARGYSAAALNGDIAQKQRESTINNLKKGKLDILVATDVAARGLDVDRVSHVINYDVPHDTESYVHRIGRTGRAGRKGDAILLITPRERRMLSVIERATKQRIELWKMPTADSINDKRIADFKQQIASVIERYDLTLFEQIVAQYVQEHEIEVSTVAAALARMVQGDQPLLVQHVSQSEQVFDRDEVNDSRGQRAARRERPEEERTVRRSRGEDGRGADVNLPKPGRDMERFLLDVGSVHGVKAGNIVGAIANELGIDSEFIERVTGGEETSSVDLPEGMPDHVFKTLQQLRVCGRKMQAERISGHAQYDAPKQEKRRGRFQRGHTDKPVRKDRKPRGKK